ncbi:MAG: divalent-cation tolerance protein CutA [Holosporaceae bacterium]|jgi:periplasmic divalent cation tolerance protein|nr:divalent-cation tolerance protein CutA [Holosporaceae bacterium]
MDAIPSKQNDFSVVITTTETKQQAKALANKILEERLAACVQVQKIESFYRWKDKIERGSEYLLAIKTKSSLFQALSEAIRENHDYQTPEIIQIPILNGLPEYLAWINDITS